MDNPFIRTEALLGDAAIEKLKKAHVCVFGLGGVGGYAVEALARSGVGELTLVDNDTVSVSNINRQILATVKTVGQLKTEAAKARVLEINPECKAHSVNLFFMPETAGEIDFSAFDYVVDAIDSVTGKIELVMQCEKAGVPIISSMGTGNKLDPTAFEVTDVFKTSVCPLARVMRRELKARGVKKLKVVYSKEEARTPLFDAGDNPLKRQTPASVAFVPSVAGLIIAGEVVKEISGI